jgi:hypothetical protein
MRLRNIFIVGLLFASLTLLGCASTRSDELRQKWTKSDWQYCCSLQHAFDPAGANAIH